MSAEIGADTAASAEAGCRTADPFPALPENGVEPAEVADEEGRLLAADKAEGATLTEDVARDVKEIVLAELEACLAQKLGEVWQKAEGVMQKSKIRSQKAMQLLSEQVTTANERQQSVQVELQKQGHMVTLLQSQLAAFQMAAVASPHACSVSDDMYLATSRPAVSTVVREAEAPPLSPRGGPREPPAEFSTPDSIASFSSSTRCSQTTIYPADATSGLTGGPQISLEEMLFRKPPPSAHGAAAKATGQAPAPLMPSPAFRSPTLFEADADGFMYTFTLRKADGVGLGVDVSYSPGSLNLKVNAVTSGGAIDSWNRQCSTAGRVEKAVRAGDGIARVNQIEGDPEKMLQEIRDKFLLKLTICRSEDQMRGAGMFGAMAAGNLQSWPVSAATLPDSAASAVGTPAMSVGSPKGLSMTAPPRLSSSESAGDKPAQQQQLRAEACIFVPETSGCWDAATTGQPQDFVEC
eukprot:gnl/TRDRNA2_/TRDRNA2_186895_c0_seq1.p1 gnl/TRDRNA2_/TRDRNA2_186895_c0~~gnl/TRDRNA2_/TRDRNA2_186895_c0_seq1.p1  ORF type:complete len:466 (-),score=80.99 gnl/TRDRNA2_/TRDRNA2_186895_c0_seq1:76-1473(-)